MTKNKQITLDNLTSALKAVYGKNTEAPLLIFRHWAARNYNIAQATAELIRETEENYLEKYHATPPLERLKALDLLKVYGKHFYETANPEERAAFAVAAQWHGRARVPLSERSPICPAVGGSKNSRITP